MTKIIAVWFLFLSTYSYSQNSESNDIGMIASAIEGINIFNDSIVSLESMHGKYVFVDFWATTCGPCIREFPNLKTMYEKYNRTDFEILGIVEDRTKGNILSFIKEKNVIWPTIIRKSSTTNLTEYKVPIYPTSFLINPNGKIIAKNLRGKNLSKELEKLLVPNP